MRCTRAVFKGGYGFNPPPEMSGNIFAALNLQRLNWRLCERGPTLCMLVGAPLL